MKTLFCSCGEKILVKQVWGGTRYIDYYLRAPDGKEVTLCPACGKLLTKQILKEAHSMERW